MKTTSANLGSSGRLYRALALSLPALGLGVAVNSASVGRAHAQEMSDLKVTHLDRGNITLESSNDDLLITRDTNPKGGPATVSVTDWKRGTLGLRCQLSTDESFARLIDIGPMGGGPTVAKLDPPPRSLGDLAWNVGLLKSHLMDSKIIIGISPNIMDDIRTDTRKVLKECFDRPVASNNVRFKVG